MFRTCALSWLSFLLLLRLPAVAQDEEHVADLCKRFPQFNLSVELKPFVVLGDVPQEEFQQYLDGTIRWAVTHLKRQYFRKDPPPLDVWLFKDAASYESHVRELTGSAPTTPYGFYSPGHKGLFMNIHTGGGTLVHELVHPFIHANFPRCPAWFNEGLASLYEQCGEKNGRIWGYPNWRLPGLQEAVRAGRVPSFAKLAHMDEDVFYNRDRGTNYGQARYLCLYLQEKGLLRDFYHRFQAAAPQDPSGQATLQGMLGDLGAFQPKWEAWVLKLKQ